MEAVYDDLASLSLPSEEREAVAKPRWQWLRVWGLVSGFAWQGTGGGRDVELTVLVRGAGLEHCTGVTVCPFL